MTIHITVPLLILTLIFECAILLYSETRSSKSKSFSICFQEEFLDVIYWMRQLLSIVLGVVWGIIPLQGFVGILM